MLKPGDTLGAYEIVAQLRRGGMATLYLAQRSGAGGFSKHVAIKVVHPHLSDDPKFAEMFLDEARLSARIDHPNVVHVYELGEGEDGAEGYYLAMEYVHGCSLSQLLGALSRQGRRLSVEMAVWIASRIAAGLHAAHELTGPDGEPLGVVHRDVSPQNVLLAYKGYVKLIDFGIAKARGRVHQTTTGLVKGKYRYMAPEQAAARPVDRRTDEYALGVLLWEMLTMRRLFDAEDDLQLIAQVRSPQIQPPRVHDPRVPEALEAAVMTALAPDPAGRFDTMRAFQQALGQAVPEALALDAHDLSRLLSAVMADEIERSNAQLPDGFSRTSHVPPVAGTQGDDVLRTMTVALTPEGTGHDTEADPGDVTRTDDGVRDMTVQSRAPDTAPASAPGSAPPSATAQAPPPAAELPETVVSEPTPTTSAPSEGSDDATGRRRRNLVRLALPLAALFTAIVIGVAFAMGTSEDDAQDAETEEPTATAKPAAAEPAVAPGPLEEPPAATDHPPSPDGRVEAGAASDSAGTKTRPASADEVSPSGTAETDAERRARRTRELRRKRRLRERRQQKPSDVDGVPIIEDVQF